MAACSHYPIRSFGLSGRPPTAYREKRGVFLERLVAQLQLRGFRFTTTDLEEMVRLALSGLVQQSLA
jgi:hypothetical protein